MPLTQSQAPAERHLLQHPWARAGRVEREEIPRQNYILYNKSSITFRVIEDYFHQEGMVLNGVIELGIMEAIKELVKLGLGVSVVSSWIARPELEAGSVVALPLGRHRLRRRWGILHWRGKRLNLGEETFVGLCEAACALLHPASSLLPDSYGCAASR